MSAETATVVTAAAMRRPQTTFIGLRVSMGVGAFNPPVAGERAGRLLP